MLTARTLRLQNGKVVAADGPFAETNEQLGEFILIEAKNMDDTIRVASMIPPARPVSTEVQTVWDLKLA